MGVLLAGRFWTPLPPEAGMRVSSLAEVGVDPPGIAQAVAALGVPEPSCSGGTNSIHNRA